MSAEDHRERGDTRAFQGGSEPHSFEARTTPASTHAAPGTFSSSGSNGVAAGAPSAASRRAHLRVSRVNPWSVLKFGFVVSLVCFIVLFVAVAVLYGLLALLGVFEAVSSVITTLGGGGGSELFAAPRILGYAAFLGGVNVVLITLLATVGAFIYNLAADLVGGVEVTLTERE